MPSLPATAISAPGQAWPRRRRLLRRADFRAAYEQGMRRSSPHFTVFGLARPATAAGGVRFGITASRKVGSAVVRNRLRRRTRELLRRLPADSRACDIVVNPRPSVAHAPFAELAQELEAVLQRLQAALAAADRTDR